MARLMRVGSPTLTTRVMERFLSAYIDWAGRVPISDGNFFQTSLDVRITEENLRSRASAPRRAR
ncbi:hypothetical protein [Nocardia donostiensis]|uniref:Uncharacterized protein n=1 Tax=Nocardia donostiensis TaxID=1538463 RepID=A0A1W0B0Z5_9NOCA|nr:hypothetical protein [Nocardia donostiensis]ONM48429.1 hypothetical protein B0T46_12005 [Nocardia donostiensis]OQS16183.1 hypothetical protein B0T36_05205 [Nocardia donostiensis]OQS17839.1 hypothetical protein B0T44_22770 [Nocardia donostiensis]